MTRELVCGGRAFDDWRAVHRALNEINGSVGVTAVIHGGCSGADRRAGEWAREWGVVEVAVLPDWKARGRAAGPIRNALMLRDGKPDMVLAFPGGRGTADMVAKARKAGVPVVEGKP